MEHLTLEGTHYEIGLRLGALLKDRGHRILDRVPFPITEERQHFAAACLPACRAFFPELLEEIRGLAAGQNCREEPLQAVLLSMYALAPACLCSCLAVSTPGQVLLGRNSDFWTALEDRNLNLLCRPDKGYSFTGNTTAFVEMEDGVNSQGLAAGLTSVYTETPRPGLNAGLLVRLLLERCRTTSEALALLRRVPISSAQTLTLADAAGEIAVAECGGTRLAVLRPAAEHPYVCAVNGFHALPAAPPPDGDDWQAQRRWQTLRSVLDRRAGEMDAGAVQDLLAGREGFLCQYDRRTGRDTVWSVVYDLRHGTIFRAEGNPGRTPFRQDKRFGNSLPPDA